MRAEQLARIVSMAKENESFYKFNRVDSKNSFNESKINHNIINSNNKYIHVRSHSSKKNVVYRKLKLKLKASVEQEKNNNSVIKNMKRKILFGLLFMLAKFLANHIINYTIFLLKSIQKIIIF